MSRSKKYCSTTYHRFAKAENAQEPAENTQEPAEKDELSEHNLAELNDYTRLRYEYAEELLEQYTLNKRDAKELLKLQIQLIESYSQENLTWSKHTVRLYLHLITDFVTSSPTIGLRELKNFVYSEFKIRTLNLFKILNWPRLH